MYKRIGRLKQQIYIEGGTWAEGVENRALRKIFEPKKDEVTWEWRKLHKEELSDLYFVQNIVRGSHRELDGRGVLHVWGRGEVYAGFLVGKSEPKNHLEDQGVDGRTILSWIFSKWDVEAWTRLIWLRIGTGGGHL